MSAGRLRLKFEDKEAALVAGCAWVVCNGIEITADCATYSELNCRLREIEADIAHIRKEARKNFERVQGKGGRGS
jgi:prophage maintenance system killer protein